jgi:hypothetical protein
VLRSPQIARRQTHSALALPQPDTFAGVDEKILWLGFNPRDKNLELWVLQQGFNAGVSPSKLSLCQHGVNLTVTHAVKERGLSPAFALGHEVMGIALGRRDRPAAQGADHDNGRRRVQ